MQIFGHPPASPCSAHPLVEAVRSCDFAEGVLGMPANSKCAETCGHCDSRLRVFWNYQAWLGQQNSEGVLGIMIITRENFREMFGYESERRTILSLAIHGRPSCLVNAVYSK